MLNKDLILPVLFVVVNMMALIIGMSVVGGVLILSICCCICCCCCCKDSAKQKLKWMREDALARGRSEERKARYAERYSSFILFLVGHKMAGV